MSTEDCEGGGNNSEAHMGEGAAMAKAEKGWKGSLGVMSIGLLQFCLRLPLRVIMTMMPIMFCKLNVVVSDHITLGIKNYLF